MLVNQSTMFVSVITLCMYSSIIFVAIHGEVAYILLSPI